MIQKIERAQKSNKNERGWDDDDDDTKHKTQNNTKHHKLSSLASTLLTIFQSKETMVKKKFNVDRTLVLRICDERLQARIREKMAAMEDEVQKSSSSSFNNNNNSSSNNPNNPQNFPQHQFGSSITMGGTTATKQESKILDLAGVTIEPAIVGSSSTTDETLWKFHCDGATYPARLTNLPLPVELHKTHDHAMYYKCSDIAQMLIVYEDMTALEEAESMPRYKIEGFPSYYHSGLTPPTSRVVEKRFKERKHSAIPPPSEDIQQVEKELIKLIETFSNVTKPTGRKKGVPKPVLNKVMEEVEEVVVQYEPWMGNGIEFDENDDICMQHPEVWLDPSELQDISRMESMKSANRAPETMEKLKHAALPDAPVLHKVKKKKGKKKKDSTDTVVESSDRPQTNVLTQGQELDEIHFNLDDIDFVDNDSGIDDTILFEGLL